LEYLGESLKCCETIIAPGEFVGMKEDGFLDVMKLLLEVLDWRLS